MSRLAVFLLCVACTSNPNSDSGDTADTADTDDTSDTGDTSDTATAGEDNAAAWLATAPETTASALMGGATLEDAECASTTDGSCLTEVCATSSGCMALATLEYESTPDSALGGANLTIAALFAQFVAFGEVPDARPVLHVAHGGAEIGDPDLAGMYLATQEGYAVLASHYRGSGGSEGTVEGCLGEVDDVTALVDLARDGVPGQQHFLLGGSHGGCIALGALHGGLAVDAAVALHPGVDGARRYAFQKQMIDALAPNTGTCGQARSEHRFLVDSVGAAEAEIGELPGWETTEYACDDPAYVDTTDVWTGVESIYEATCSRSPLTTATDLATAFAGDLLVLHGERDPFIEYTESCHYTQQAGGFSHWRMDETNTWTTAGGCAHAAPEGTPPTEWAGARHLVLVEAFGHGDVGRPSLTNPCENRVVSVPPTEDLMFDFLATRWR